VVRGEVITECVQHMPLPLPLRCWSIFDRPCLAILPGLMISANLHSFHLYRSMRWIRVLVRLVLKSASRHASRLTAHEPAYTVHGACTPGLSVQVIAYRSTPKTYITLDSSQHQYRMYSVIACFCHDETSERWIALYTD